MKSSYTHHCLSVIGTLLFLFTSCTQEEWQQPSMDDDTVQLSTHIVSTHTPTRIATGLDGKGSFVEGDAIMLYLNSQPYALTLQSGQWTPRLSWSDIPGHTATFSAFYPAIDHGGSQFKHTVQLNQHQGDNFEHSDLLHADAVTANSGEQVNLNFRHLMSCATVVLESNVYTPEQLQQAEVRMMSYNAIDVNPDGTLGKLYDYRRGVKNIPQIRFRYKEGTTFQAVLCPQKVNELSFGGWLKIKIAGREFVIAEPPAHLKDGTPFVGFESGKNVTLTYTFNDKDPEFCNKTVWVEGLKDIPAYSSDAWEVFSKSPDGTYIRKHLPWQATYGWYDCSKRSTTDPQYDDMNMCWAAASSNMIHWWMDRNRSYVDRYCALNHIAPSSIPQQYHNRWDSEVFQLFKDKFIDEGGFPKNGLNWFFLSKYYDAPSNAAHLIDPNSGGYFKDVFGSDGNMTEFRAITNVGDLTKALKYAFKHQQSIAFTIIMPGFGSAHALTLWGAEFNEYGDVSTIYYVDNNDATIDASEPIGLIASKIGEYKGRACMENSQGNTRIEITDLTLLNLKQFEWDNYFKNHPEQ